MRVLAEGVPEAAFARRGKARIVVQAEGAALVAEAVKEASRS